MCPDARVLYIVSMRCCRGSRETYDLDHETKKKGFELMDTRSTIAQIGLRFPLQTAPIVRDMGSMSVLASSAGVGTSMRCGPELLCPMGN